MRRPPKAPATPRTQPWERRHVKAARPKAAISPTRKTTGPYRTRPGPSGSPSGRKTRTGSPDALRRFRSATVFLSCSSPIRRNSGTCTSNTRYRLRKTRKSPMPSPVSRKVLKAVGVCCCVIRARNLCAGLWLKGRMPTRYACMPTNVPESWKKRSDRRGLRTVQVHCLAFPMEN